MTPFLTRKDSEPENSPHATFSQSVVPTRLPSSLQVYKSTRRRVSIKNIVRDSADFRSIPTKDHLGVTCERVQSNNFIRTVSSQVQRHRTHVPSRAKCRVAPIPTVIRFCTRLTANTVSPQSETNHVATHPKRKHTSDLHVEPSNVPTSSKASSIR